MTNISIIREKFNSQPERRWINNFLIVLIVLASVVSGFTDDAIAYPTLQLDIKDGYYDSSTETIVASGNPFILSALLIPDYKNSLTDTYYISAAVVPKIGPDDVDLGSFSFEGDNIISFNRIPTAENEIVVDVTGDMVYGVPPFETAVTQLRDKGDLAKHGIYYTYFAEFGFTFSESNKATPYNTQDNAGDGPTANPDGSMYYANFTVDVSALDPAYAIHFDLYNAKLFTRRDGTIDVDLTCYDCFAPFSKDAESGKVPEPSTLLLLGSGLVALVLIKRRKK